MALVGYIRILFFKILVVWCYIVYLAILKSVTITIILTFTKVMYCILLMLTGSSVMPNTFNRVIASGVMNIVITPKIFP